MSALGGGSHKRRLLEVRKRQRRGEAIMQTNQVRARQRSIPEPSESAQIPNLRSTSALLPLSLFHGIHSMHTLCIPASLLLAAQPAQATSSPGHGPHQQNPRHH